MNIKINAGILELKIATSRDAASFAKWSRKFKPGPHPLSVDAHEFASLAFRRWREGRAKGRALENLKDLNDFIQDNPHCEVSILVLAKATWMNRQTVGICHFRRTWCNHLCIDYLTFHPRLVHKRIPGIGTAMLHFVCTVAEQIESDCIWFETTQNSVKFYRKLLNDQTLTDVVLVRKAQISILKQVLQRKSKNGKPIGTKQDSRVIRDTVPTETLYVPKENADGLEIAVPLDAIKAST